MSTHITFTIIKPDAMIAKNQGKIIDHILRSGFNILALKQIKMSLEMAQHFYAIHKERPFFGELTQFMSSHPVIVAVLEKPNAVAEFRKTIGATDPTKADEGTIRKVFAKSIGENAIHGSDSDENALAEASFFFPSVEFLR